MKAKGSEDQSETLGSSQIFQWENYFDLDAEYNFGQRTVELEILQ